MSVDTIVVLLLIISAGTLLGMIVRKLPTLRSLDVDAIRKERNARVKEDLIAQRLQRKLSDAVQRVQTVTQPARSALRKQLHAFGEKVTELEAEYRERAKRTGKEESDLSVSTIQSLLESATTLEKEGKYDKAEQKYIEIIGLAPKTVEAYMGLGKLYFNEKNYGDAIQSYRHAQKLKPDNPEITLDLVMVAQAMEDFPAAVVYAQEAVRQEPNDPKALHALIETSLGVGNVAVAEEALTKLVETNPDNQRIEEFKTQIATMRGVATSHTNDH